MKLLDHRKFSLKLEAFIVGLTFLLQNLHASLGMKSVHLHLLLTAGLKDELFSDGLHSCQIWRQLQPMRIRLRGRRLTRLLTLLGLPSSELVFLRAAALRSAAGGHEDQGLCLWALR